MKFNWEAATTSEIVVLYETIRSLLKPKGLTWKQIFAEASPNIQTGINYEKNFSRGKIASQRAKQIAEWLEARFPETASYLDELLTSVHSTINAHTSWEKLIEEHGLFSNVELEIVRLEERFHTKPDDGATKIERESVIRVAAQYEVKLHSHFTFKIESPFKGHLCVLQWSRGLWWPVPLSDFGCWAPINMGAQWCPYDPKNDEGSLPHLLSEHTEIGLHRLVFIIANGVHPLLKKADPQTRLEPTALDEIAETYRSSPSGTWQIFRLNVLFKALDAPSDNR